VELFFGETLNGLGARQNCLDFPAESEGKIFVVWEMLEMHCAIVTERRCGAENLGSGRASRAGFGASPKRTFRETTAVHVSAPEKVRDGEGAITSTRGRVRSPDNKIASRSRTSAGFENPRAAVKMRTCVVGL
jgi:hypothetical protein